VSWTWCNGEFIDGPLAVSPADRGLTHGLGVFDTLLAIDGRPVALEMHLERMRTGVERLGWLAKDLRTVRMEEAIAGLLKREELENGRARVRIAMTAGPGDLRTLDRGRNPLVWITASVAPPPPESIALVTAPFPRNEASPLAGIKCASYAENLVALDYARRNAADEALFYNTKGELCEGTTSNVFLVKHGKVFTPPLSSGCLPGTMRARVIVRCRELGIPLVEDVLTEADVKGAKEVFVTSSTRGVVAVRKVDGNPVHACPGEIALRLKGEGNR
jgi:branched-chain amino acid aminotransferase